MRRIARKRRQGTVLCLHINDLPAFAAAGVAATVANARPEVKERADLVAASYSELGVLKELKRIIYS